MKLSNFAKLYPTAADRTGYGTKKQRVSKFLGKCLGGY